MTDDDLTHGATAPEPAPRDPAPRQLDHAPGDRYRGPAGGPASGTTTDPAAPGDARALVMPGRGRAIPASLATGAVGAVLFALVGSFDLGLGLLAVAAFIGWLVAVAVVWGAGATWPSGRSRAAAAAVIAGAAVVVGLALLWAWSRIEGGVLGPLDYLDQRFGLLPALDVLVAAVVAGVRAR